MIPYSPFRRILFAAAAAAASALLAAPAAFALPVGGTVTASTAPGSATIANGPGTLTVTQTAQRVFIDWASFNIAAGETVTFNQQSATAIAFNRVPVGQPVTIAGTLNANAAVWLFTPGGLAVSSTGVINTGSFVASLATRPSGSENGALTTNAISNAGPAAAPGATISIASGAQVKANTGFVGMLAKTINQNGTVTSNGATAYVVADGGGFTFSTASGGLVLTAPTVSSSSGVAVAFNHGGTTQAGGFVEVVTPPADLLASGFHAIINLSGVIQADGVIPTNPQFTNDFGPTSVLVLAGGNGAASGRIGVDASQGQITARSGLVVNSGDVTLGGINAGRLRVLATDQLNTTRPIQVSGPVELTSFTSGVRVGSTVAAASFLDIYAANDIALAGNMTIANNGEFGAGDSIVAAGGSVTVADNVSIIADGYLDISTDVLSDSFAGNSGTHNLTVGAGAILTGGVGLGLQTSGKLTVGAGAKLTSRYGKNVIARSTWPFLAVSDDNTAANDGGMSLVAASIDLKGDVYSYRENGTGRGPILIQSLSTQTSNSQTTSTATATTLGGTDEQPGFHLSNAEFQHLHGGLVLMLAGDSDGALASDFTVRDLTLDSNNLDSLWIGTPTQSAIRVTGLVQGAGTGTVDLRLGYVVVGNNNNNGDQQSSLFALQAIPKVIEISGGLGTAEHPLGQVGLISAGDILMGSTAYIEAARAADFDPAKAPAYGAADANHLFVSADGLQMASPARILQQNTAPGRASAGLRVGAPTADRSLIIAPDIAAYLKGERIDTAQYKLIDYKAGPTRIELHGVFSASSSSQTSATGASSRDAAKTEGLLGAPLTSKPEYTFNTCAFGGGKCANAEIPQFQPQLVTLTTTLNTTVAPAPVASAGSGSSAAATAAATAAADDSSGGDLVLNLTPTSTAMAEDEEEQKRRVSLPITGSGNGDLWVPLDAAP